MKTTATIQPARSAGVAMAVLGGIILCGGVPFSIFVALNFTGSVPPLFFVVPVIMGLIGIGSVVAGILQFTGKVKFGRVVEAETTGFVSAPSSQDRLDELERLKRRDMITPEEYTAKRQEILKDL